MVHHLTPHLLMLFFFFLKIFIPPYRYRDSHCFLSLTTFATFLYLLLKRASPNTSTCIPQRTKHGPAALDWSAFMPLRVRFTVCLPTCLSVSQLFLSTSYQTVCLWILQRVLYQDTVQQMSGLLHCPIFYTKVHYAQ